MANTDADDRARRRHTKAAVGDTRRRNRELIFDTLLHSGAMTRAQLSRASGLTAPTVSAVTAELIDEHVVIDTGEVAEARLGKPASLLQVNDRDAVVIALNLARGDSLVSAAIRPTGQIVRRWERALEPEVSPDVADDIERHLTEVMGSCIDHVLGVSVGMPGIIDSDGTVLTASNLNWSDIPLAKRLRSALAVPVHVVNDVNAATVAARSFRGIDVHNLLLISIEHGVGAGLIIGDTVVEGETFAAGEVGHVTVDPSGPECVCGRRGCLEVYLSPRALREQFEHEGPAALERAGRMLGRAFAGTISTLDLSAIAIAGPSELISDTLVDAAVAEATAWTLAGLNTSFTVHRLVDDADLILHGALGIFLAAEFGMR